MNLNIYYPKEDINDLYIYYKLETSLINQINHDQIDNALSIFNQLIGEELLFDLSGTNNKLRSIKNQVIYLISIICHSVINNGVSPYIAMSKAKAFIGLVEKAKDKKEIQMIGVNIIKGYSKQVHSLIQVKNDSIKKALNYIHNHLGEDLNLEQVAKEVNLSKCYFCSQFKKETHMTFSNYLTFARIERSKFLLQNSDKKILDIAISLGFSSQSYFSAQFKKHTNLSPKKYRDLQYKK
ncbi:AraC-like DNA-binding protein [Natranaerovirga hydrolytica]|uniref:AraC-like DNA-binding protein n=1 Tax=Natranaerovirga hydrolytica TaxID=680378 RepID=A0A4R1ML66_9FIRM|nr:AraC family transcriptional regulator [Natranaerovirga hydrolytica]TCK92810.1 AraC-like DNA-binding protein [Natranaerovirga hydrolytica]